ncbi:interferon-inducible GTPase 1-like [Mya arenaria]|uniref:interferon-inducible GTPase 1-like n=1 Tax=Mya arenaria TaxID=6604 RepID=UPI0022E6B09B|nr:interferon-inducible GTPase 1-like [Mya arenaria]
MAGIIEEDHISMKNAFKTNGLDGLKQMIVDNRDKWESIPVRIAVTGNSGVGKSSFINAFLGLKPNAPGAAAVGITETTMQVKAYPHPMNENFVLYDLPGVGTQLFPRESYLEKVDFQKYDFFVILSATRFTENDAWLGHKVKLLQKKFFFVRTKIDSDMENEKEDFGEDFNRERSLSKIRADAQDNLRKFQGLNANVYLITTKLRKINQFDFSRLMQDVISKAPMLKNESLVLFLPSLTKDIILEKEKVLLKRAYALSLASGIAAVIPVPGLGVFVDGTILVYEALFYRKQFNLNENSLKKFEKQYSVKIGTPGWTSLSKSFTATGLLKAASIGMAGKIGENAVSYIIPGLGSAISAVLSYRSTCALLQSLIKTMRGDALIINADIAKRFVESI